VPPLEVWERVLINSEAYRQDVHSYIPCTTCHGGQADVEGQDMEAKYAAHEGVVQDPSIDAVATCGECHTNIAEYQVNSLHYTLRGYDTVLYARSTPENHPILDEAQGYHCQSCHATCGQCHVSQPTNLGGGLVSGHVFQRTPSMTRQCTACHGSRVKDEYTGAHEGLAADVHLRSARMVCTDCHTGREMHGLDYVDDPHDHRYDGPQGASCETCHLEDIGAGSGNPYHEAHGTEVLSCQACHSVAYTNCYACHLDRTDDEAQLPFYRLEHDELGFYIGRNPRRDRFRPYRYVPLRHVPAFPEQYQWYGDDVLSNFDALPTWAYATPHNIQRNTPQTASCEACHGNDAFFLTPDKVDPEFINANAPVIVPFAPPLPEVYEFVPGEVPPAVDPLDAPPVDPLDAPPVDPLDAPPVDPLDAPPVDPLDAPAYIDPLDAPP
jgi:hypothetical protein